MANETKKLIGEVFGLSQLVQYAPGAVVSRTLIKKDVGTVTLFAFDAGEALSTHQAPYDAMITILDGKAKVVIEDRDYELSAGQMIIMPANKPHSVTAAEKMKMMLVMIKQA